jgi:ADP-dependent NAD(P)H-hydrate dehydratase / NAD(P)H-hydrate epimerase
VRPVLTVGQTRDVDADALESVSESILVERAGTAVATWSLRLLGGAYGRRVVVVAGKGNNGADGRVAAERLRRRGARVDVLDAADAPERLGSTIHLDLVIDAAYGTGFKGSYKAPSVPAGVQVLAVDIPSGINGNTGEASGEVLRADLTVTFGALKPGLIQGDGPAHSGRVEVAGIGLDPSRARMWLVEDADVSRLVPARSREANKWQSGVVVVAGSPGMLGAASLCSKSAYRAGAGMVRLAIPGESGDELPATEAVAFEVPRHGWAPAVLEAAERCRAVVLGPGIGRDDETRSDVRRVAAESPVPIVVDADGLFALGDSGEVLEVAKSRKAGSGPIVLTPHAGEFARIFGRPPGIDKVTETLAASRSTGCIFLLKGSTTVVARDAADARVVMSGGPSLATAGTGDVLSGAIGAFLARGTEPLEAAALAAHAHGRAAALGPSEGLMAGDIPDLLAKWLSMQRPSMQHLGPDTDSDVGEMRHG